MSYIENCEAFVKDFMNSEEKICYLSLQDSVRREIFCNKDFTVIDLADNHSPLAPFLDIVSGAVHSESLLKEILNPAHYEIFNSYFKSGLAEERFDIISEDSMYYEWSLFVEELRCLMTHFCKGNFLILNSQYMSFEASHFFKTLDKVPFEGKLIFCFNYDSLETESILSSDILEFVKTKKNFLQYYEDSLAVDPVFRTPIKRLDFKTIYTMLRNSRLFLLHKTSSEIVNELIVCMDELFLDENQHAILTYEIALSYFYSNMLDEATLMFNRIITTVKDNDLRIVSNFYLSKVYFYKKMNSTAFKYAVLVEHELQDRKNSPFYAFAIMQEYNSVPRANQSFLEKRYFDALQLLEENKLWCNYIDTAVNVPGFLIDNKAVLESKIIPIIEKCMEIAKRIKNRLALSNAYQWKGIILSRLGKQEESTAFFNESLRIRVELNDLTFIIRTRNGLSFESLIRSEYRKAYDYLNEYVSRLDELSNYRTVINTMRNIALPLFYSHNFLAVREVLQLLVNIIKIFNLDDMANNSFLPEYNDIQIYRAFVEYQLGYLDRARISIYNIQNNKKNVSYELYLILYFLQAAFLMEDGMYEQSMEVIDESIPELEDISSYQGHILIFIIYEFAILLRKKGMEEKSEAYFKKGFELAKRLMLPYYTHNKLSMTLDEYVESFEEYPALQLNIEKIKNKTNKARLVNQFHKKIEDYRFLNKIMTDGAENISPKAYISRCLQTLFDYSIADAVFIGEKINGKWKQLDSLSRIPVKFPSAKVWNNFDEIVSRSYTSALVPDVEENRYFSISEKFGFVLGIVIQYGEDRRISVENMNILNIAISDIQSKFIILKQNECLEQVSAKDQLSGLYNRRALIEYIDEQSRKIKRYNVLGSASEQMVFAFVDLDNFKFYNDTFGHKAGDFLIKAFSELLESTFRKSDFVCRYGGDEFLVVLKDCDCLEAEKYLVAMKEEMRKRKYFVPDLEKALGKSIEVPENRHLGFSCGLCSSTDVGDREDLRLAIDYADKALYHSKKNHKGSITIYSDFKIKNLEL